ncbi:MAG: PAS-domain containing protein, partial [Pseudomonadales bacterium]
EAKIRIESQKRSQQLISAFDKSSEVLLILDARDKFVFCNEAFKQINQSVLDKIYPNAPYETYLRAAVAAGTFELEVGDVEAWIEQRLSELRLTEACFEVTHSNGRRFIFNRKCLDDGTVISIGTDITAQKAAQLALESSEARFRDFALIGADWFWEMGPDLSFTYIAGNIQRATGIKPEQFIGRTRAQILGENTGVDKTDLQDHLKRLKRHESFNEFEIRWQRSDEDFVYLSISGQPRFSSDGEFLGYRGAGRDVTQRYLVEQQDQRLIAAVDSLNLIITIFDRDDKLIFFNRKFKEFNVDIAPLIYIGMSFTELWKISVRNQERKSGVSSAHWYQKRMEMHRNPGEAFVIPWADNRHMQIYEQKLGDGGTIIVATDITDSRRAEEQIRQLRNYLVNIIDSMPSILIGVDQYCRVTQWNLAAEKETGIALEDAVNLDLEVVFPRLKEQIPKLLAAIESRQQITHPKRIFWRGEKAHYEDITIYPLKAEGGNGAVIRLDDVTEQVLLSEMMIQSEKMLSVGGLAAGMAHEINNPLAGMMQTANVMLNRLSDLELPANIKAAQGADISLSSLERYMDKRGILRMVNSIINSGERVAVIVENMLSFSRQNESITTTNSLSELMDKSLELSSTDYNLKREFDFRAINITKDYQKGVPSVYCEGPKIQQVLLNILRNGAQAMQEAHIEHPAFVLRVSYEQGASDAVIEIEDNGPGIAEEVRRRIFEPFFTTKAEGQGTGLGLSVSYFIVTENHGGKMSVESEVGKGAVFRIELPVDKQGLPGLSITE